MVGFPKTGLNALTLLAGCFLLSQVRIAETSNKSVDHADYVSRRKRQVDTALFTTTFDFSRRCPPGIAITLRNKLLTANDVRLSATEAFEVSPFLYGQSLDERIDILCLKADANRRAAASIGRPLPTTADITEDILFEGDILLTRETAPLFLGTDKNLSLRPSAPFQQPSLNSIQPGSPNFFPPVPPRFVPSEFSPARRARRRKRKILRSNLWPGGRVPWRFQDTFGPGEQAAVRAGIASWQQKTCLVFPQISGNNEPHINFVKSSGCFSNVGVIPNNGGQPVSLPPGCQNLGIVTHEIGHAIGFAHEQSRPDRDNYVSINRNNIPSNRLNNFLKRDFNGFQTRGVPYDFSSVMHYAAPDFGINPNQATTQPRDQLWTIGIGQRNDLSFWDAKAANIVYCSRLCGRLEPSDCENEGYLDYRTCRGCICPPGLSPETNCREVVTNQNRCGSSSITAGTTVRVFTSPAVGVADCYYQFTAPIGMRVTMEFTGTFRLQNPPRACESFVEVRYQTMSLAGPRACGRNPPRGTFISHGNSILLRYFNTGRGTGGGASTFSVQYRAEPCGGCSSTSTGFEAACLRTTITRCDELGQLNRCFDPIPSSISKRFCCRGYRLEGANCRRTGTTPPPTTPPPTTPPPTTPPPTTPPPTTPPPTTPPPTTPPTRPPTTRPPGPGIWGPWSRYSACSATCGLCGFQRRTRFCRVGICIGNSDEFRNCPANPCITTRIVKKLCFVKRRIRLCKYRSRNQTCCVGRVFGRRCFI